MKKLLFTAILLALPMQAQADCNHSAKTVRAIAQNIIDKNYAYNDLGIKKPKLTISNKEVDGYDAEELNGTITLYSSSLSGFYCDQYFNGLALYVTEITNHEYIHAIDEKLNLSEKINEKEMSEKTAYIGEHVFKELLWKNSLTTRDLKLNEIKKYNKLMSIIKSPTNNIITKSSSQTYSTHKTTQRKK